MAMEIERKFLVGELPEVPRFPRPQQILQQYIARADGLEVRIRQGNRKHWLTIKSGDGLKRKELEVVLSAKQFQALQTTGSGQHIQKMRYRLPLGSYTAELDIYEGELKGLKVVEVEFPDVDASTSFIPPGWFGPEVTGDALFSNANLASLNSQTARQSLGPLLEPPLISYGAIPVIQDEGETRVVLVTTKSRNRWIFPKGTPEDDKTPQTIAKEEAIEEAGVEGTLVGKPLAVGYWRDKQYTRIEYWPLRVSVIHNYWDESQIRERIVCTPEEAREFLANPAFTEALDTALERLVGP